jgi:2-haloacid dehalogenase
LFIGSTFRGLDPVFGTTSVTKTYRTGDREMINVKAQAWVFDAYGTLFDVHAAIGRHRAKAGPEAERFSEMWRTKQLEYTWTMTLAGHYADFWTLTERALDYTFARVPSVDRALRPSLLEAYLSLDPFTDARSVLAELKSRGLQLAILSNGSPPMLDAAVSASGIGGMLDAVLSVDTVRAYKPRPEVYALVTNHFGIEPHEVVFVSSNRWDIMGAASFGFRPLWVNRARMPDEFPEYPPGQSVPDLSALPSLAM